MKIVASITDASQAAVARDAGADLIECRLDLMAGDAVQQMRAVRESVSLPVIATFRSAMEGGRYFGNAIEWFSRIEPVLPFAEYVDIEQRYSGHAPKVRESGRMIIASHHEGAMIPLPDLFLLERELRVFGDIPKIIVTPQDEDDLIDLISFTKAANKPIATGVMRGTYRWARAVLPLLGSELVYCHAGVSTAEGQYSVAEFVSLMKILKG